MTKIKRMMNKLKIDIEAEEFQTLLEQLGYRKVVMCKDCIYYRPHYHISECGVASWFIDLYDHNWCFMGEKK